MARLIAVANSWTPWVRFYDENGNEQTIGLSPSPDDLDPNDLSYQNQVAFTRDGTRFAIAIKNNSTGDVLVYVYDTSDWSHITTLTLAGTTHLDLAFSPDGTKLAVAIEDSPYVAIYDTSTWTAYSAVDTPLGTVTFSILLAWSNNSDMLCVCGHELDMMTFASVPRLRVYDVSTTTPTTLTSKIFTGDSGGNGAAFSPDDTLMIAGGDTGFGGSGLKIYDTAIWSEQSVPPTALQDAVSLIRWMNNTIALTGYQYSSGDYHHFIDTSADPADPTTWVVTYEEITDPGIGNVYSLDLIDLIDPSKPWMLYALPYTGSEGFVFLADPPGEAFASQTTVFHDDDGFPAYFAAGAEGDFDLASPEAETVAEGISAADACMPTALQLLLEALGASDTLSGRAIYALVERIGLAESLAHQANLHALVMEACNARDTLRAILPALVEEVLALGDDWEGKFTAVASIVDTINALDSVDGRANAAAVVALVLTLGDDVLRLTAAEIVETLDGSETLAARLVMNLSIVDLIDSTVAVVAGRRALVGLPEEIDLTEGLSPIAQLNTLIAEGVEVEAEFMLFGEVYQGWVVRTDTLAPTEYQNYPFNSMCKLGQRYYGASETGLHLLDGETDAGDPIRTRIVTGEMDFNSPNLKRIERAYFGMTARGDLVLKVIVSHAGQRTEYWYRAEAMTNGERTESRVKIGEGIVSRYWQFELVNTQGADFEIDRIDLDVRDLKRRI